jgi:hypothetical protein
MRKNIIATISAILLLGSVVTGWVWVDSYFGHAEVVAANTIDIKINSLKDDIRWYQDQMAFIMSRCGTRDPNELPDHAYKNYMDYKTKKEELEKQLELLLHKRNS